MYTITKKKKKKERNRKISDTNLVPKRVERYTPTIHNRRFINRRGTMTGIGLQGQSMHLKRTKKSGKMETRGSSVSRRGRSLDRDRINPGQIEGSRRITAALLLIGHRSKGTNGASPRAQISRCDRWKVSAEFLFGDDRTGRGIRRPRSVDRDSSIRIDSFVSYVGIFYYCYYFSIFVILAFSQFSPCSVFLYFAIPYL